jgi:hypothetical protein
VPACVVVLTIDLWLCTGDHLVEPVVLDTTGEAQPLMLLKISALLTSWNLQSWTLQGEAQPLMLLKISALINLREPAVLDTTGEAQPLMLLKI